MKATVSRLAVKSSKSTTPYPELDVPCEIWARVKCEWYKNKESLVKKMHGMEYLILLGQHISLVIYAMQLWTKKDVINHL